jgi:hypothetical protein
MFRSRYLPCAECGESVDRTLAAPHACSRERWAEYQLFGLSEEIAGLEAGVLRFLGTPLGRFETCAAARLVRGQA